MKRLWDLGRSLVIKYREIILYLIFGVLTTVVNYLSYYLFTRIISLPLVFANILAWVFAVIFAYFTNRKWVFNSKNSGGHAVVREFLAFVGARVFSGAADTLLLILLVNGLSMWDMAAKLITNIMVIILNYIFSKFIVFRDKKGS